jgi:hypothetical protein
MRLPSQKRKRCFRTQKDGPYTAVGGWEVIHFSRVANEEECATPPGLERFLVLDPGLTPWANFCRACGD